MAPLERFLGCIYMRRILQRVIQESDCLTSLPITEPGVIPFRYDISPLHFLFRFLFHFHERWPVIEPSILIIGAIRCKAG